MSSQGEFSVLFFPSMYPKFIERRRFLLGCQYGNPSRKVGGICSFHLFLFILFFSVSVKVWPVTPLVSGVFVHRAFCAYFLRMERVVEMRIFLWWTQ